VLRQWHQPRGASVRLLTSLADDTTVDPDVIRTIVGEVAPGDVAGAKAVASVLYNRRYQSGEPYGDLITDPNQFEARTGAPWQGLQNLPPTDPKYQAVASAVTPILAGKEDPIGSYTHYYSPQGQAAAGRAAPAFDDGTGVNIGGNRFFTRTYQGTGLHIAPALIDQARKEGHSDSEIYAYLSASPKYAPLFSQAKQAGYKDPDIAAHLGLKVGPVANYDEINAGGQVINGPTTPDGTKLSREDINKKITSTPDFFLQLGTNEDGTPIRTTDGQNATIKRLAAGNVYDATNPQAYTTLARPYLMKGDNDKLDPSWYAIRPNGDLIMPKGKEISLEDKIAAGAKLGALDVANSVTPITNFLTGRNDSVSDAHTALNADPAALTGPGRAARLAAQLAITTPVLIGGGEAEGAAATAAKGVPILGKTLQFMAGRTPQLAEDASAISKMGNGLVRMGSHAVAGAQLGAGGSALVGEDPEAGAVGGALVPLVGEPAAEGGKFLGDVAHGIVAPFTEGGRRGIASDFLRRVAEGGPIDVNANELIPGSQPTLAQSIVGGNAGISAAERAARNTPGSPMNMLSARDSANMAARSAAFGAEAGTPESVEALTAQRNATAGPMREAALAPTGQSSMKLPGDLVAVGPSNSKPVVDVIDQILASPVGQRDVVKSALTNIRQHLVSTGADGKLLYETNPAQLYGIRQQIGDIQSPASESGRTVKQLASKELSAITAPLDDAIEQGAPGFKKYLSTYSDMSKPIDRQTFLQSLGLDRPEDFTPSKVNAAVNKAEAQRALPGARDAKSLTDDQMNLLHRLRDDTARDALSRFGTRNIGSSSIQNLATSNLMDRMGIPGAAVGAFVGHQPLAAAALGGLRVLHGAQNPAVMEELTNMLLNPSEGEQALMPKASGIVSKFLRNKLLQGSTAYGALPAAAASAYNPLQEAQ
jgi:hypothetical protein